MEIQTIDFAWKVLDLVGLDWIGLDWMNGCDMGELTGGPMHGWLRMGG